MREPSYPIQRLKVKTTSVEANLRHGLTIGSRSQHGRPEEKVERPHVFRPPPSDLGPLAAREGEGCLAHVESLGRICEKRSGLRLSDVVTHDPPTYGARPQERSSWKARPREGESVSFTSLYTLFPLDLEIWRQVVTRVQNPAGHPLLQPHASA